VARSYAAILGPLALAISLLHGLLAGGGAAAGLWTAWAALWVFAAVGGVIGWLAEQTIRDSVNGRIAAQVKEREGSR